MISDIKKIARNIIPEGAVNFYHLCQAVMANIWYGFPAKKITIIGVTGTNGKTTTSYMISKILDESGNKNAMATTIYFKIGNKQWRNNSKMTTLDPFVLQKFLRDAVNENCQYAIVETTSHAISQHRIWGLQYDTLVFTNITHDHLDYHKTFKNYLKTKIKLFADNKEAKAVLNADSEYISQFKKASHGQVVTYSMAGKGTINAKKIKHYDDCSTFAIAWLGNEIEAKIKLLGDFNIANSLAAFAVGMYYNISPKTITLSLGKIAGIAGRLENADFGQDYKIYIDFAHTPDGLKQVFETVRPLAKGKLIHIGGATGDRDRTKRPILGALSGQYADISIVTDKDCGSEDPKEIIKEVATGVTRGANAKNPKVLGENYFLITDRTEAIRFGLSLAKKGDIVLVTGKGHEQVMKVGDKLIPYSDQKVVKEYFVK